MLNSPFPSLAFVGLAFLLCIVFYKSIRKEQVVERTPTERRLEKELEVARKTINALQVEKSALKNELAEFEKNKKALIEELGGASGSTERELLTWEWVIGKLKVTIAQKERAEAQLGEFSWQKIALEEQLKEATQKLKGQEDSFNKEKDELHKRLQKSESDKTELHDKIKALLEEIDALQKKIFNEQEHLQNSESEKVELHRKIEDLQEEIDDLQKRISDKESQPQLTERDAAASQGGESEISDFERLQEQYNQAIEEFNRLKEEQMSAREEELLAEIDHLQYRLEKLHHHYGWYDVLYELMEQAGSNFW